LRESNITREAKMGCAAGDSATRGRLLRAAPETWTTVPGRLAWNGDAAMGRPGGAGAAAATVVTGRGVAAGPGPGTGVVPVSEPSVVGDGGRSVPLTSSSPPPGPDEGGPLGSPLPGFVVVPVPLSARPPVLSRSGRGPPSRPEPPRFPRAEDGFDPVVAVLGEAPGVVEVVGPAAGAVVVPALDGAAVPLAAGGEPEGLEVLAGRDDDEPLLRRVAGRFVAAGFVVAGFVVAGFVVAGFVVAGFVAAGFVAGAGVPAGAAVGVVAGAAVGASAVVELGGSAGASVAGSGAGAAAGSGAGVLVAVPLPVPLLLPLLLLGVVEPDVVEPSATATLALLRLVSAMTKTALTTTRPNPRRGRCPPEASDRWGPKLRTAARPERITSSRASRRPTDRPSVPV
jgi:hypothetical protein